MTFPLAAVLAASTPVAGKATSSGGWLSPIAKPIAWVLAHIYAVIPNYGVAILVLSIVWMIIIAPLTLKSTRSMLAMQKLQPQLKKLQEQHKNDRQAFAQAQMELFREHNVSPFGSCLPMLLPLPVFFALFRVIDGLSHKTNGISTPQYLSSNTRMYRDIVAAHGSIHAFGMDLAKNALSSHSSFLAAIPFFVLLLIMIGTQYAQTAQMMSRNPAAANQPQAKLMKFLPLFFGVICVRFPAGVVLYYGMSNVCRIAQQSAMYRFDPKVKALVTQDVIEVEAHTQEIDEGKGKAKNSPAKASPPPQSRFQRLLANAQEQQAGRSAAKGRPAGGSSGPGRTAPAKGGGAKGGTPAKAANARAKSTNGSGTKSTNGSGTKGVAPGGIKGGNGGPKGADAGGDKARSGNQPGAKPRVNGNGNGNGTAQVNRTGGRATPGDPKPPPTGGGGRVDPPAGAAPRPRTGRTGARSGANRKRRGR